MTSRKTTPTSTSRREELRRRQQAEAAATRRTGIVIKAAWAVGLAVIAVMFSVIVWAVLKPGSAGVADGTLVAPKAATDAGAIVVGDPNADVTVSIYADFMCPFCGSFERANGADLDAAIQAGTARLEIHPLSFLDAQSAGGEYSTRSANALVTVADADPDLAWALYRALYENQPEEGTTGLTDAEIAGLAGEAGVSEELIATFEDRIFVPWVQEATQKAFDSGVTGTPTVKINGQTFTGDLYTAGPLAAAIEAAGA